MDILEIKNLWDYFSLIWEQKIAEINWEKKKKRKKKAFSCSLPAWVSTDKLFELGSFLGAFYLLVLLKTPLLAWQIRSGGNRSVRTGQVWDKNKLFCKWDGLLPACAYFSSCDNLGKNSLVVSEMSVGIYSDKTISSESREQEWLYPMEETDSSTVTSENVSLVLCSHVHRGTLLSWAAMLTRKWGKTEHGAGSWMEKTKLR